MRSLSASSALTLWETGRGRRPLERALLLARAVLPECSADEVAGLPIGRRDAAILRLRQGLNGNRLDVLAACPGCGADVEVAIAIDRMLDAQTSAVPPLQEPGAYRLPTTRLLEAALAAAGADGDAAEALACACATGSGEHANDWRELESFVSRHDPLADIELEVRCPECASTWHEHLDPVSLCWQELEAACLALVADVATLARAFGWSERDILDMSEARRAVYLELAR